MYLPQTLTAPAITPLSPTMLWASRQEGALTTL